MDLNNARVLLTGGSSGIGKATAKALIDSGSKVLITGRDENKLRAAAEEIGAQYLAMDVADYDSIPQACQNAVDQLGGIDVLINNAGIGTFSLLDDVSIDDFEKIFSTNVFGLALITKEIVKHFKAQQKGNIINIASSAGTKGFAFGTVYAASKFALRGMTQCWMHELRKSNVRVMLVNPSEVPTAFNQEDRKERELVDNKLHPEDIAHMIKANLEMNDRGFVPELGVWATNPF